MVLNLLWLLIFIIINRLEYGKKNFFVGEPQIIPDKNHPYDEKKTNIIFIIINRKNNDSFFIICNYKLDTLKTKKINTILNMGIHSSFY